MNILPTMEGGLRLEIESPLDWNLLAQIQVDASKDLRLTLPEQLGALMDDESDWDDLVQPDLGELFSDQLTSVSASITQAEEKGDEETGELFIPRDKAELWYGALNQARLALESRYHFGPTEAVEEIASFPPSKRMAFIRSQFYCMLQSILLEYAIE